MASIGTTATTALDPLRRMAELAERHALWLHVDAALAGTAMVCPEYRWMWDGVERADSVVLNPHKWLGAGFDLTAYYVRDPEHLVRVMSTDPSYLRTAQDGLVRNLRDWGIPLGRRFRALKLWFVLRDQGVEGVQARVRRDIANARWLAEQVDAAPDWERLAPVPLQTVCLRHVPGGAARGGGAASGEAELAAHNAAIAERLNAEGRFYLTTAVLKGSADACASRSAPRRPSAVTSRPCGGRCGRPPGRGHRGGRTTARRRRIPGSGALGRLFGLHVLAGSA